MNFGSNLTPVLSARQTDILTVRVAQALAAAGQSGRSGWAYLLLSPCPGPAPALPQTGPVTMSQCHTGQIISPEICMLRLFVSEQQTLMLSAYQ